MDSFSRQQARLDGYRRQGLTHRTELEIVPTEEASARGADTHFYTFYTVGEPSAAFIRNVIIDRGGALDESRVVEQGKI